MELKWYGRADAKDVRSLLLDVHDEVYADDPDPFHSRERFSYFVDLWSGREDWTCVSGWEDGRPVGYAYGSKFKPGGWWKGADPPGGVRGRIFALSELMVVPRWQGAGRGRRIHDALVRAVEVDFVTLLVDSDHAKVQALYERWGYEKRDEAKPSGDSPLYAVMVRDLTGDAAGPRIGRDGLVAGFEGVSGGGHEGCSAPAGPGGRGPAGGWGVVRGSVRRSGRSGWRPRCGPRPRGWCAS